MQNNDDIISLVEQAEQLALKNSQRALVIQPGALGDCILTLGLVRFLKERCRIGSVVFIGHSDYIDYFLSRSQVDGVKSIDSIELHKLFVKPDDFLIPENDRLFEVFAGFSHIISFMSPAESDFEKNLITLVHCLHSAQITSINLKPPIDYGQHITTYYIQQYLEQNPDLEFGTLESFNLDTNLLEIKSQDIDSAKDLVKNDVNFVLIAPGSGGGEKCWNLKNFIALAQQLNNKGLKTVFVLGYAEIERFSSDNINLLKTVGIVLSDITIPQILGLGRLCKFYIGNDSGISHLLGTAGIKIYSLFHPTNPNIYRSIGTNVHIIRFNKDLWHSDTDSIRFVMDNITL